MTDRPRTKTKQPPPLPAAPARPSDTDNVKTTIRERPQSVSDAMEAMAASASGQIQAISMKPPDKVKVDSGMKQMTPALQRPNLRPRAETPAGPEAQSLGYLAPPQDPQEHRARQLRENIMWGSIAVIVASVVALGIWFLGR